MSSKQIAEKAGLPEKTVSRIFSGDTKLATFSETVHIVSTELDQLRAENARLKAEAARLNSQLTLLLQQELKHKDEIIALHDFYNKRKPSGIGWVD